MIDLDNSAAFDAFAEVIHFAGVRKSGSSSRSVKGSVSAQIVDNGFDETFDDDGALSSKVRRLSLFISASDFYSPQIGDVFALPTGEKFAATSVNRFNASEFIVEARQK